MKQAELDLLVMASQNGNKRAFAKLFETLNLPLIRFAHKMCRDDAVAQEATQEAWIKMSSTINTLNDARAFKSWMFKLVRWRVLDIVRKQASLNEESLDTIEEQIIEEPITDEPINDELNEANNELNQAMAKLPSIERQALHLFYLEEMKINDIATVLDIPSGTVKSRLNRARQQLRDIVERSEL